jgi:hypothetical protein
VAAPDHREPSPPERVAALLAPGFTDGLDRLSLDELHERKAEAAEVETAVSYYRRLAQARIEILDAWAQRPTDGVESLVAELPRILGAASGRSSAVDSRFSEAAPAVDELDFGGRERLVVDDTLANLTELDHDDVAASLEELRAFERDLSSMRRDLHQVIDAVDLEIASRQAADTVR